MGGFPFMAIGAGLGQGAEQIERQRAQQMQAQQMQMQMQMQRERMRQQQEEQQALAVAFGALKGTGLEGGSLNLPGTERLPSAGPATMPMPGYGAMSSGQMAFRPPAPQYSAPSGEDADVSGGVTRPGDDLAQYAVGNAAPGGPSSVEGVAPEFSSRIGAMTQAMPPEIRSKFNIISGFRSPERQAQVNPGVTNSRHSHGLAVDTTNDPSVIAWINQNGPRFGVGYTISHLPGEQNHLEMLGPGGGRAPIGPSPPARGGSESPLSAVGQLADAGAALGGQQLSPEVVSTIQRTTRSIDPFVQGRMSLQALVNQIDKTSPDAPAAVKMQALILGQKLLAPAEQMQMKMWMQENQADLRVALAEMKADRSADSRWGDPIKMGEDYVQVNRQTGEVRPVQGLSGDVKKIGGAGKTTASGGREEDIVREVKRLDDEWATANPDAAKADKEKAHFKHRNEAEAKLTTSTTKSARTPSGMHMRKFLEEHPDATPEEISSNAARFTRDQSIERAFSSGQAGNNMRALNTVAGHLQRLREYAEALDTGDLQRVNQLSQWISRETGGREITNFNIARDITADEVVRLLTSTGGTEADRRGMQSRIAAAFSPEQMGTSGQGLAGGGALDVLDHMVSERFEALRQSYARNDPKKNAEFDDNMLMPEARRMRERSQRVPPATKPAPQGATPKGGTTQGGAGGGNEIPLPADLAAYPDGQAFEKDGATWVKRGDRLVKTPGAVRTPNAL